MVERRWMQCSFNTGLSEYRATQGTYYTCTQWLNDLEKDGWTVVEVHTVPYGGGHIVLVLVTRLVDAEVGNDTTTL